VQGEAGAGAVVLAAGEARRFGSPKLLMPFGDSTVLGCVVSTLEAAHLRPIVVVAGPHPSATTDALATTCARVVSNPDPARGMLSSVRVGVAALPAEISCFAVVLGDQPRLRVDDLLPLLREHRRRGGGIIVPTYCGKRGHPIVFGQTYCTEILALDDHQTLRDFIHRHHRDVVEVEVPSDAVLRDIDTREQYEDELRRSLQER
jgi:molybdenum cofactor cytidylyltransferase